MDPVSAALGTAGTAAGLTGLAITLFGGCIKGFVLISTARNLGKDSVPIICLLNIQEVHLVEWGRRVGLLSGNGTLDHRLNREAVEAALSSLRDLLLDVDRLRQRYGLDIRDPSPDEVQIVLPPPATATTNAERILTRVSDTTRRRILRLTNLDQTMVRRMRWATVDKEKLERLATDVRAYVRELCRLLDPYRFDDLESRLDEIAGNMIQWNDQISELLILKDAFIALQTDSSVERAQNTHFSNMAGARALQISLGVNGQEPEVASSDTSRPPSQLPKLQLLARSNLDTLIPSRKNPLIAVASYAGQPVVVEVKEMNRTIGAALRSKLMHRAENLAALLHTSKVDTFQSLTCMGIVEKYDQLLYIFEHPRPTVGDQPQLLLGLYSSKKGKPPSLTARIKLALQLSIVVRDFHRMGWIHKNLRSENFLFFPNDTDQPMLQPLLAGFCQARLDSLSELSETPPSDPERDIYRHPMAMGDTSMPFSVEMDIYALGTILLEISEWRPLRWIVASFIDLDKPNSFDPTKLQGIQEFLIEGKGDRGTSRLRERAGDIYYSAVLMCLRGSVEDQTSSEKESSVERLGLLDVVIRELKRCIV